MQGLKPAFNGLSGLDRMKLKGAAFALALTGFIRDDVREKPWRYPFYAAYMAVYTATLFSPLPFDNIALMAATYGWARRGRGPGARELNKRLTASFNEMALIDSFCDCLSALSERQMDGRLWRVRNRDLFARTVKDSFSCWQDTTRTAWQAGRAYFQR